MEIMKITPYLVTATGDPVIEFEGRVVVEEIYFPAGATSDDDTYRIIGKTVCDALRLRLSNVEKV